MIPSIFPKTTQKNIQKKTNHYLFLNVFSFLFSAKILAQNPNDLIISEIMADPTPTKGLPEKEYIEIFNRSNQAISLNKFRLQYGNTLSTFPNVSIEAKEYIIVTNNANVKDFQTYGKTIGLNPFSLLNTGNTLSIKNPQNKTIFSVTYSDKWYAPNKNQGFSLEIIDPNFPCVEEGNWTSSEAILQGTPAKENSVKNNKPDLSPPTLSRYEIVKPNTIKLIFSEKLDSLSAISKLAYSFDKNLIINQISIESPVNKNVTLALNSNLEENTIYQLTAKNIADCSGNVLLESKLLIGNLKPADSSDIVLNEILFHPRSDGEDFVEIYNRTDKLISLKNWSLANVDKSQKIANLKTITSDDFIIQAKQYLVLTRNAKTVQNQYFKAEKTHFLEMAALPSYPNEEGSVVLLNAEQKVFDRFDYSEDFHHPILDEKAGVSLEKIDFNKSSSEITNWHSASASEGYATPGYFNSQGIREEEASEPFTITPPIITPDGDGVDEFAILHFINDLNGYVANVRLFDANGRFIRQLAHNQLLGSNDSIIWDGKDSGTKTVSVGYYILFVEVFHPNGQSKAWKGKVVVGSRF
jgi:hypothetical protein